MVRSLGQKDPLEKGMATPAFLPGKSHGQRSLVGYSPWGRKRFGDTTYQLRAEILQMQLKKWDKRETASLMAKWQGICRPVRETKIQPLIWEDPTCCGATRPVSHC